MCVRTSENQLEAPQLGKGFAGAALLLCTSILSPSIRILIFQYAREAVFWIVLASTVINPMHLLPRRFWILAPALVTLIWFATMMLLSRYGNPMPLFAWGWREMTSRFSLMQISVFGSAILHSVLTMVLNIWPVVVQNIPHLQRYKIQKDKPPASAAEWGDALMHIVASQLLVQLPLIFGQYIFIEYFSIPYDYETIPGSWSLAWRLALSLIIDDTWVYFGHRALHDRRIYKYVHKVHHTYTSPFAPDAEYEHPIETVFLGIGFFLACMAFQNHLAFMWAWLYTRLVVTYDSHSGYDLPFNPLRLFPLYCGALEHDWHHQFFNGNYAPTFVWWDRLFGTNEGFEKHRNSLQGRKAKST